MVVVFLNVIHYNKVKINIELTIPNYTDNRYDGDWLALLVTVVQARYQCEDKMFLPHLAPPTISPSQPSQPSLAQPSPAQPSTQKL